VVLAVMLTGMLSPLPIGVADETKAGQWPQFLGPERNGVSQETGLIDAWPEGGPAEVWRVPGGGGMSGLAIADGRVYTLVQKAGRQFVICLNAQTGKSIWETPVAKAFSNTMGNGPRATPTVSGDQVFAFTGEGILAALNTKDGSVAWTHDVIKEHGSEKSAEYGMASSPLVVDGLVIVTAGAREATVVAYDGKTGQQKWTAGRDQPAGYSSPALLKVGGRQQVVVFHGTAAEGFDPETGTSFWRYPYITDYDCNIATPIAFQGNVFLSAGENHGSVLLSLSPNPDANASHYKVSEVWQSQGPKSVLRNEWQTSVLLDGKLFGFDNVGSAGPVTHLSCVDIASGVRNWQELRFGKGNLIAADGKLLISTMKGELVLVAANAQKFQERGRTQVLGMTRQAPALSNGFVFLRDEKEIVCLDLRKLKS
jgi:outer membrane protein assembly factor BamB